MRHRGAVICVVTPSSAGFAIPDSQGRWTGFDAGLCRVSAAAIVDDPEKVGFVPLLRRTASRLRLFSATARGEALGLDRGWAYRSVRHIGDYGESFERNLGRDSPLTIERGQNALWTRGGLHDAAPIR